LRPWERGQTDTQTDTQRWQGWYDLSHSML